MYYLIIDLEATCWKFEKPLEEQEVIEIGAFMLSPFGEVEDQYQSFVKPEIHPILSHFCMDLTGIRQEEVERAPVFSKVYEDFLHWIQTYNTAQAASWGAFDQRLLYNCCIQSNHEPFWSSDFVNLKKQYQRIKGLKRPIGLKNAVEREGFEFRGNHHRALDDAANTVSIFKKYLDEWIFY